MVLGSVTVGECGILSTGELTLPTAWSCRANRRSGAHGLSCEQCLGGLREDLRRQKNAKTQEYDNATAFENDPVGHSQMFTSVRKSTRGLSVCERQMRKLLQLRLGSSPNWSSSTGNATGL